VQYRNQLFPAGREKKMAKKSRKWRSHRPVIKIDRRRRRHRRCHRCHRYRAVAIIVDFVARRAATIVLCCKGLNKVELSLMIKSDLR